MNTTRSFELIISKSANTFCLIQVSVLQSTLPSCPKFSRLIISKPGSRVPVRISKIQVHRWYSINFLIARR